MAVDPAGNSKIHHPLYDVMLPTWIKAHDVYEGMGGFLDPDKPYLVPFPREYLDHSVKVPDGTEGPQWVPNANPSRPSPKLVSRRKLARYENIAEAILDTLMASLFYATPTRTWKDKPNDKVVEFIANADGKGGTLDQCMRRGWTHAAVFSHSLLFVEKAGTEAKTQADTQIPRLCHYTPADLIDWLEDEYGQVIACKFVEPVPRTSFETRANTTLQRVRIVDQEKWTLYNEHGEPLDTDAHGLDRLPVAFLYGKRRVLTPVVGKPVIGDPQLYIDAYNLTSEVRELLRNQTFGLLNIPVGQQGDVQREKEMLGVQSGTASAIFSTNAASFISPAPENVVNYHDHIERLQRLIYRLASVPWEADSRDAEAAESRKLKRSEMEASLKKYSGELQRADDEVIDLVYRALYGPDKGEKQREADGYACSYPDEFEPPDYDAILKRAKDAVLLELGEEATKEVKRRTVRVILPNLDAEKLEKIDAEIDASEVLTQDERQEKLLEASATRMAGGPKPAFKKPAA